MIKKRLAKKALTVNYFNYIVPSDNPEAEPIMIPRNPRCYNIILRACVRLNCPQVVEDLEKQFEQLEQFFS